MVTAYVSDCDQETTSQSTGSDLGVGLFQKSAVWPITSSWTHNSNENGLKYPRQPVTVVYTQKILYCSFAKTFQAIWRNDLTVFIMFISYSLNSELCLISKHVKFVLFILPTFSRFVTFAFIIKNKTRVVVFCTHSIC